MHNVLLLLLLLTVAYFNDCHIINKYDKSNNNNTCIELIMESEFLSQNLT